jgi:sugar porter (SP) family MFS transporter
MMSLVNTNHDYLRTMGLSEDTGSEAIVGLIVAVYYLGCTCGAVFFSALGDHFGRKIAIFGSLASASLGNLIMFVSGMGYERGARISMFIGRVVMGLGVGGIDAVIPTYSAELAADGARGNALAKEFQMNIFGLVEAFAVNFAVTVALGKDSQWAWRIPIMVMQAYPVLLLLFIEVLPESPRWFIYQNRIDEARQSLLTLYEDPKKVDEVCTEILENTEKERGMRVSYLDMITPGHPQFHPTIITIMCQINQMFTAYGAISVYGPQIFELLGFDVRTAEWLTLINFIVYFFQMTGAWLLIDAVGRRRLLLGGSVALSSSFVLLTIFGGLATSSEQLHINWLGPAIPGVIVLFIATGAFGIGWLATIWEIPVEIYPTSARAQGAAVSVITWGLANFAVTLLTPVMFAGIGYWLFLVFAATNTFAGLWTWIFLPESGNRSFEENQRFFEEASAAGTWRVSKVNDGEFTKMIWKIDEEIVDAERVPLLHRVAEQLPS